MVQTVNVTLDDYSPLIDYSPAGAWIDGSTSDPFWQSYDNNGTFTLTTVYGASATLTFNGTTVWIYGAKRGNHGPYNVTLDGKVFTDDGFYDGQVFQQVLFSAVELDGTKPHTVSITNSLTDTGKPYLDIDSIVYQVELPDDYQEVRQQDTAGSFQYSSSGWTTDLENLPGYDGGTGHTTSSGDSYVVYAFEGSHVELYGMVGPSGGPYTVQLDDGPSRTFNASRDKLTPQTILYQNTGLSPGEHTVRITNSPFSGQALSIDYAVYLGPSKSSGGGGASPNASPSSSSSLSGGAIGGVVGGSCGLIIIILIGLFFWYRRRHRRPAILPVDILEAEFASADGHGSAESWVHLSHATPVRTDPSPYQLTNQSESGPSSSSRLVVHHADSSPVVGSWSSSDASGEKRRVTMREQEFHSGGVSHQAVLLPNGSTSTSEEDIRNSRMRVEGRVQDFGPVAYVSRDSEPSLLPPDYRQATEPFHRGKR